MIAITQTTPSSYHGHDPSSTEHARIAEALRALAGNDEIAAQAATATDCGDWNHIRDALVAARATGGPQAAQRALAAAQRRHAGLVALLAGGAPVGDDDDDAGDAAPPPPLPLHGLPRWVQNMVTATAEAVQVPVDFVHALALGVVSTATAGAMRVEINASWTEETCLYLMPAMLSGERKSAAFAHLVKPVEDWEECERQRREPELRTARAQASVLAKRIERLETEVSKERDEEKRKALEHELIAAHGERERAAGVASFYRLVQNATPEALISALAEQQRIAILTPEPDPIFTLIGKGRDGPALYEPLLKGYNSERLDIRRQTRERQRVEAPALTMLLVAQPSLVRDLIRQKEIGDRGLLPRFLILYPPSRVGSRDSNAPPVPDAVRAVYTERLHWLLDTCTPPAPHKRHPVTLSAEANSAVTNALSALEPRLDPKRGDLGASELLRAWANKLIGHIVRIAANLHAMHCAERSIAPWAKPISGETMRNAIAYIEPLVAHMQAILGDAAFSEIDRVAQRLRSVITEKARNGHIARRDLERALLSVQRSTIDRAIRSLIEAGELDGPIKVVPPRRGRPSLVYRVISAPAHPPSSAAFATATAADASGTNTNTPRTSPASLGNGGAPAEASASAGLPASAPAKTEDAPVRVATPVTPVKRGIPLPQVPPAWCDAEPNLRKRLPPSLDLKRGKLAKHQPIGFVVHRRDRPPPNNALYLPPFDLPERPSRDEMIDVGVQAMLTAIAHHWPDLAEILSCEN